MSLEPETISVKKKVVTNPGYGATASYTAIWTGQATRNYYASNSANNASVQRAEQGQHNTAGPGVVSINRQVFIFRYPNVPPDIQRDYKIQAADGSLWRVLFVRPYTLSLQVDCEFDQ